VRIVQPVAYRVPKQFVPQAAHYFIAAKRNLLFNERAPSYGSSDPQDQASLNNEAESIHGIFEKIFP
jgi:hypothetical protein